MHFKNSLGKAIITGVELQEYLKDTYDFKLHLNTPFLSNYKVNEYMREFKMSFTNSNVQRSTTFGLIKKFSNSKKVAQYKKNKKTFTIPELHKYMLDEKLNISVATLYNYSNEILQLGIPININKMIINQSKYGEKDIINKLCSNILKKGINKIYAGQLSKISRQLSLPNLGYKKILEYQKYIQKIYDIEVVDFQKSIIEKEKILNTIEENHKCLNTLASPSIVVVELLPSFHDVESDILVLQGIEIELKELWVEYLKLYIKNLSVNRVAVRNELIDAESNLTIDTENKKIFFLYHNDLNIQNLTIEDIIKLSKKEVLSKDKLYGIHRQNMFIGFLIYLYTKGCLLISFDFLYHNYYKNKKAQTEIDIFLQDTFFYKKFEKIEKENRLNSKETKEKRFFLFFLLSINKDTNLGNVTEDYFYSVDNIDSKKSKILKKVFNKLGTNINITSGNLLYTKDYYSYMKKVTLTILL